MTNTTNAPAGIKNPFLVMLAGVNHGVGTFPSFDAAVEAAKVGGWDAEIFTLDARYEEKLIATWSRTGGLVMKGGAS